MQITPKFSSSTTFQRRYEATKWKKEKERTKGKMIHWSALNLKSIPQIYYRSRSAWSKNKKIDLSQAFADTYNLNIQSDFQKEEEKEEEGEEEEEEEMKSQT